MRTLSRNGEGHPPTGPGSVPTSSSPLASPQFCMRIPPGQSAPDPNVSLCGSPLSVSGSTSSVIDRDLSVFWHPCSQMRDYRAFPPLHVVRARGTRLQLADGSEILDAISSWWCKSLGHGHPHLREALTAQL